MCAFVILSPWHPNCLQSGTRTFTLPRNKESSHPDVTTIKSIMFQAFLQIVNSILFTFLSEERKWTGMGRGWLLRRYDRINLR